MNKVYIALGTNLGDRQKNLETALEELAEFTKILKKSSVYDTEPVGYTDQGNFLNMAVEAETELTPVELMFRMQEVEHKMGRIREIENGPRIIDLDLLFYENKILNQKNLRVPHQKLHLRSFVLDPMLEIAPDYIHPELNKSIKTLKSEL
ncbi:MAG: 2-amino-4-hydroxy-6-hydroxymethyldihydropteridine diphosphokinase [Patescibacteria group bacterium]